MANPYEQFNRLMEYKASRLGHLTDEELAQLVTDARQVSGMLQSQSNAAARLAASANKQLHKRKK